MWPIVRPRLNETRTFSVEYRVIPGQIQIINITPGWNAISVYLKPKDTSLLRYLEDQPYRSVFSPSGEGWTFNIRDSDTKNLSILEPGRGYLIDSSENFTIELRGKPVDLPYRITLGKGWNLIGVPFNRTFSVNNITVNAEHKRYSYSDAVEKGLISAFLWSYDGIEWNYVAENDTLIPGNAYLLEASNDCRLEFR